MQSEKSYENQIKGWLTTRYGSECNYIKQFSTICSERGVSDLIVCVRGYYIAIEVKKETGVASDLQKRFIRKTNEAGGLGIVTSPSQFNELKLTIETLVN